MNRFWDKIILPLFIEINPKYIVEIGSDKGLNTKNILDYCHENESKLTSIDPSPNFDVEYFKEEFNDEFDFIMDLSLNCLDSLDSYDIILIDGDHNWYTVYNELKTIEKNFDQNNFPLIILHDVSWPYGRRDMYYNPKNIPSQFLNEFNKLGMKPNKKELLDVGGINQSLNNAIIENTPKNGVLTAIEDFIFESKLKLSFYKINGFNGLGLIYPENNQFTKLIQEIVYASNIGEIVEMTHYVNSINKDLEIIFQHRQISELNKNITSKENSIIEMGTLNERLSQDISSKVYNINVLKEDYDSLVKSNATLKENYNTLVKSNATLKENHDTLVKSNATLLNKLNSSIKCNESLQTDKKDLITRNVNLTKSKIELVKENNKLIEINENLISEKKSLIESNKYTLSAIKNENEDLVKLNKNLTKSNLELNKEFNRLKGNNNTLIKSNEELSKLNQNLEIENKEILLSNSWKITSPLRKLKRLFK